MAKWARDISSLDATVYCWLFLEQKPFYATKMLGEVFQTSSLLVQARHRIYTERFVVLISR